MRMKVVIADDEERIRGLVLATLGSDERYDVLTAVDGADAVSTCRAERPDLLFLDLLMPKMDGYAVCRELKKSAETRDIKIVMLTAMAQESDRRTAMKLGVDDFVTKPFSPTALAAKLEELLAPEDISTSTRAPSPRGTWSCATAIRSSAPQGRRRRDPRMRTPARLTSRTRTRASVCSSRRSARSAASRARWRRSDPGGPGPRPPVPQAARATLVCSGSSSSSSLAASAMGL